MATGLCRARHCHDTCADQSKRPLVKHPQKFGCRGSTEIASKFPDARTFGFYTGKHSGITLCDVDDTKERVFADALDRHDPTPIHIAAAPASSTLSTIQRRASRVGHGEELKIDMLVRGLRIAPPGVGAKGQYEIIQGSLDDLDRLRSCAGSRIGLSRTGRGEHVGWSVGRSGRRTMRHYETARSSAYAQQRFWRAHGSHRSNPLRCQRLEEDGKGRELVRARKVTTNRSGPACW